MFEVTPGHIISSLKELLGEKYRYDPGGVSVLKEMVQNADDAGASTLRLAWCDPVSSPTHNELFARPGIAIFNDGPFTADNHHAFMQFSGGDKGGDTSKVGRFGIGRKSLFHWTEAIFFAGADTTGPRFGFINPWADRYDGRLVDRMCGTWTHFEEEERTFLRRRFERWAAAATSGWLGLWLPARIPADASRRITDTCPDVGVVQLPAAAIERLAALMPQLGHLRTVELAHVRSDGTTELYASLHRDGPTLGRPPGDDEARNGIGSRSQGIGVGRVEWSARHTHTNGTATYWVSEKLENDGDLRRLRDHPSWPEEWRDTRTGDYTKQPAKADAHGAVTILRGEHAEPKLRIEWAIFLPLSGHQLGEELLLPPGARHAWSVLLHGYFFPDSGRREILGIGDGRSPEEGSVEWVRCRWNTSLRDKVTLPLLPGAVVSALATIEDGDEIVAVVGALARTKLFAEHRLALTSMHQLVHGPDVARGRLAPVSWRAVASPRVKGATAKVLQRVAAALAPGQTALVWSDSPGLLRAEPRPWTGSELELLRGQLAAESKGSLPSDALTAWLEAFCQSPAASQDPRARAALIVTCYRHVLHADRATLGSASWRVLAQRAAEGGTTIIWTTAEAVEAYASLRDETGELLAERITALVLLQTNRPDGWRHDHLLALDEAVLALATAGRSLATDRRARYARTTLLAGLLKVAPMPASVRDPKVADLAVLSCYSSAEQSCQRSLNTIVARHDRGLAFGGGGVHLPKLLSKRLSAAVAENGEVLLIEEKEIAEVLGLALLGPETMIKALDDNPLAQNLAARLDLFDAILDPRYGGALTAAQATADQCRVLRHLLHGDFQSRADAKSPLMLGNAVQREICVALLGPERSWRVLAPECEAIRDKVAANLLDKLAVARVTPEVLTELAREPGAKSAVETLSAPARQELARALVSAPLVWEVLPIHETARGWVALTADGIYYDGGVEIPHTLSDHVRLVRPAVDADYDRALRQRLPLWTFDACVILALKLGLKDVILQVLGRADYMPSSDTLASLRRSQWLTAGSARYQGEAVLVGVDEALRTATKALPFTWTTFVFERELDAGILEAPGWRRWREHIGSSGEDAARFIVREIAALGETQFEAMRFLSSGATISSAIEKATQGDPFAVWWRRLLELWPDLASSHKTLVEGPCSPRRASRLLASLPDTWPESALPDSLMRWIVYLVTSLGKDPQARSGAVARLRLPDANRLLRDAGTLTVAEAAPDEHRVHPSLTELFASETLPQEDDEPVPADRVALEEWLRPWSDDAQASPALLGYFVAPFALGPQREHQQLFRRFLPVEDPETVFKRLLAATHGLWDIQVGAAKRMSYVFTCVSRGQDFRVRAITGATMAVPLAGGLDSVFVDVGEGRFLGSLQGQEARPDRVVRLLRIGSETERAERHRLLAGAIAHILRRVFDRRPVQPKLDALLSDQQHGGASVVAAHNMLLGTLVGSLKRLGVHKSHAGLLAAIDRLESATHQLEEQRALGAGTTFEEQELLKRMRVQDTARTELRVLIQDPSTGAAAAILAALRKTIGDHQYRVDQVVFELFQNADDACAQRALYEVQFPRRFVVSVGKGALTVRHWGRGIDRTWSVADHKRGWNRDLYNMLSFGISDKGGADTGRFGMGFKSVFLVSDAPQVQSDTTAFSVLGGVLPMIRHPLVTEQNPGTVIELPLRPEVSSETLLGRVQSLASLMPLFAQSIEEIEISDGGASRILKPVLDWIIRDDDRGIMVGVASTDEPAGGTNRFLVFRQQSADAGQAGGPRTQVVIALGERGAVPVKAAQIWVTAPTREDDRKLGFMVSGRFGLDVARGRIAVESPETEAAVSTVALLAEQGLLMLERDVRTDWPAVRVQLGLAESVTEHHFMASLLAVLVNSRSHDTPWEHAAVRGILASPLLERVPMLLDVDGTRRPASVFATVLDNEVMTPAVLAVLAPHIPNRAATTDTTTRDLLEWLGYRCAMRTHGVADIMRNGFPANVRLSLEVATELVKLAPVLRSLAPKTWEAVQQHVESIPVANAVNGTCTLASVVLDSRFPPESWGDAAKAEEEKRVSTFAPAERRLATSDADVAACVVAYRRRFSVKKELEGWIRSATSDSARHGAIAYLILGEHKDDLLIALEHSRPDWLTEPVIVEACKAADIPVSMREALLARFFGRISAAPPSTPELEPRPTRQPRLEAIIRWWQHEGGRIEASYHAATYPGVAADQAVFSAALRQQDRRAWATLVMLAICQRLGRATPDANRGFLVAHQTWIEVLADPTSTDTQWVTLIDTWAEQNEYTERFAQWLGLLPTFRRVWRELEGFLTLVSQTPPRGMPLAGIFDTRSNPLLNGTGLRLPKMERAFGTRGRVWLARELVRLGVWDFRDEDSYYVPWRLVREVLGLEDAATHDDAADAIEEECGSRTPFGRAFDVAFDVLRFDSPKRLELLGGDDPDGCGDDPEFDR